MNYDTKKKKKCTPIIIIYCTFILYGCKLQRCTRESLYAL